MRILHLIPTLSGGGAERQLALLAREHAENGVASAIIYHGEGTNLAILQDSKVDLFPLSLRGNYDPMALWAILRLIRRWQPDIIQTWLPQMDILGGIAARLAGVPHILSERSSALAYGSDWKSRLRWIFGRQATAIIANSQPGAQYWRDNGAGCPLYVVLNAITPFDIVSDAPPSALRNPCVLYAGRLAPEKNLEAMVAGMLLTLSANADLTVYILGAGPQEMELRQWIAQSAAPHRIHLIGYVNNLHPWYSHSDVFVSVSDFEGHPNVVLEAASVGCPLVLSDIPEHREAIPSDGAIFVDGHDPANIANGLHQALTDKTGSEARVKASKTHVADLSVANQSAQYLKIYQSLV